jgi:hypothetical protein
VLSPVNESSAPVLLGDELRDLGSIVARALIEHLGGSLEVRDATLRVTV